MVSFVSLIYLKVKKMVSDIYSMLKWVTTYAMAIQISEINACNMQAKLK